jgi:FtsH-binding integral membrane protein
MEHETDHRAPTPASAMPGPPAAPSEIVLRTLMAARISLGLIVVGWAVLLLPQGLDVVRGLVEDTNQHLRATGVTSVSSGLLIFQWAAFILACMWTGLNAWYWPRILFRQKALGDAPHWFTVLLRILGLLPLLAAIIALIRIANSPSSSGLRDVWIGLIVLVAALLLLATLFKRRRNIFSNSRRWYSGPSRILDRRLRRQFGPDVRLRRGDDVFFLASLALGATMIVLLCIPGMRTSIAQALGSAALAFGALGILIASISTIAWAFGRLRMPVVPIALIVFVGSGLCNDNHAVRTLKPASRAASPIGMEEALALWQAQNPDGPIILVAAAGGASRAGYWTAAVLRAMDERTNGAFARHVFAISAVSGGSLGAVGYAARLSAVGGAGRCYDPATARAFDRAFVGGDYLAPAIGGLLYPDLLQRFLPLSVLPDRASSLEEAWEVGWRRAARQTGAAGRCAPDAASDRMANDYDAIWADALTGRAGWVPLVLVNGTLVENGKRVITAPVRVESRIFEDSYDFRSLVARPIRASTAILNGARFPVVSPAGTLVDGGKHGRIVDGGYFENGGLETMLDLARFLRLKLQRDREIILIEIDNSLPEDSDEVLADLQRYPNDFSDGQVLNADLKVEEPPTTGAPALSEITSIVGGLYGTRTSRGVLAAKRLSGLRSNGLSPGVTRITFNLPRLGNGAAMSWALSSDSRARIDQLLEPNRAAITLVQEPVDATLADCQRAVAGELAVKLGATRTRVRECRVGTRVAAAVGYPM